MFHLPEGKEVAGRTPDRIHGSTYRGGQSYLRRIKGMVWKERASAEEVFQYQRYALQGNAAEGQAGNHERGRAAKAVGDERNAGETSDHCGWYNRPHRIQGSRVGRKTAKLTRGIMPSGQFFSCI